MDEAKPLVAMHRKRPFPPLENGCRHHSSKKAPEMRLAANGHVQRKETRVNVLSAAENIADEEDNVDRPQASQRKTNPHG